MLRLLAVLLAAAIPGGEASASASVIGHSVGGRPIRAWRVGSPRARRRILVVGAVHGDEGAGRAVVRRLLRARPPRGTALWLVEDLNPDGSATGSRHNAHGVDLNRNFPRGWTPGAAHGSRPLSEPESRALAALTRRIKPRAAVWYHQPLRKVIRSRGDRVLQRLYARRSRLPYRRHTRLPGTAIAWQAAEGVSSPFVVELPGGRLPARGARRHARAVLAVARAIAPPRVRLRPIPFGPGRRRQMAAYARRHYGIDDWRLRRPRVIVQHYTVSDTFSSVFNTFARNAPDPELRELPGVCAHYVIDKRGRVYELVSTRIMCRHTVGLNWTAIGIEHVGRSDAGVLRNRRQLRASLRLTRLLQGRFRIRTRNVIGHNESLTSPYHRERVARLRRQTHGDFRRRSMRRYRRALGRLPSPTSVR